MSRKNVFFAIGIFTVLTFLQPAINFFLLPVYLKYFPAEEFGIYGLANTISNFVAIFITLGMSNAVYTYYFNYKYSKERVADFMGSVYTFSIISVLIIIALSLVLGPYVFTFFKNSEIAFYPYGALGIGIAACIALNSPYLILIKNEKKVKQYAYLYVSLVLLSVIGQVLMVIVFKKGAAGALVAKLIANGIIVIVVLVQIIRQFGLRFKMFYIKRALQFSLPFLPFLFINWIYNYGDRFALEQVLDLKAVGIYTLLVTLTGLITMAIDAVMNGIQPYLFEALGLPPSRERSINVNYYYKIYLSIALMAASGVILIGSNIQLLTNDQDYLQIIPYVYAASVLVAFRAYVNVFKLNLVYSKNSSLISIVSAVFVVALLGFYFVLIPRFGLWGAIGSNFLASISWACSFAYFAQKKFPVKLNYRTFFLEPFAAILITVGPYLLALKEIISYQWFGLLQFVVVLVVLIVFNRKAIWSLIEKKLAK